MYIYLRLNQVKSKQKSKKFKHNSNYFDSHKNAVCQNVIPRNCIIRPQKTPME